MFEYVIICLIITFIAVGPGEGWFDNIFFFIMCIALTPVIAFLIHKYLLRKSDLCPLII